jgi:hypothetical protein
MIIYRNKYNKVEIRLDVRGKLGIYLSVLDRLSGGNLISMSFRA